MYTDGLRHDGGPVGRREVLGVLDVVGAVLHVPVAVRDVDLQQVLDAVLQVAAEMMRKLELHARTASFAPPGRLVLSRDPNSGIQDAWKSPLQGRGLLSPNVVHGRDVIPCIFTIFTYVYDEDFLSVF